MQGSIDWAHDSGFYAGAWASNVDFGDCCDEEHRDRPVRRLRGRRGRRLRRRHHLVHVPGAERPLRLPRDLRRRSARSGSSARSGTRTTSAATDESAFYLEGNVTYELPANFALDGHLGYSDGDGIEAAYGQDDYFDWSIGVTYALGNFDLGLK